MTMSASVMATLVMLLNVAFIGLIIFGIVKLIQYLIRYGIDYYFKKLAESQNNKED